jgi:hypothetical protein
MRTIAALAACAGILFVGGCSGGSGGKKPTATPTFTPPGGAYTSSQTVTISDTTPGALLYCTVDGSAPSAASSPCPEPITVSRSEKLSAVAIVPGNAPSVVAEGVYEIDLPPPPSPTFSPAPGSYTSAQSVTIGDALTGALIHYTLDGSQPTSASTLYSGPIKITASETIQAIAVAAGYGTSPEVSAAYVINLPSAPPTPVITTAGNSTTGTYPSTFSITVTDTDASAVIHYTTDGSIPTSTNGSTYTAPFTVSSTETITAVAIDSALANDSSAASQLLTIVEVTPTFSPAAGSVSSGTKVEILDADAGAAIYYTTDGSLASTSSTRYTASISVTSQLTFNAIAINTAFGTNYTQSAPASATYTTSSGGGSSISGSVTSGTMPIVGASIHLVAAGTAGYGQGAASLTTVPAAVTTSSSGGFSLSYTCPAAPGDQVYLVSTGGFTTGSGSQSSIVLMAALGACSKLAASSTVAINELTTVASVYSLASFAAADTSGGIVVGAPAPNTACSTGGVSTFGNSTCNYRGLANAFRTPSNLVDLGTGAAVQVTEFYSGSDPNNFNGWSSTYGDPGSSCPGATCLSPNNPVPATAVNTSLAPYQRVNTLGNVLASCVEQPDNCADLFVLTGGAGDTLQAALYIAQHPGAWSGKAGLYGLITNPATHFTPPYGNASTTLKGEPNDWTLAVSFTGAGLGIDPQVDFNDYLTNQGLAIDANGNVWVAASALGGGVTGTIVGTIAGFDPLGEALTPPTSLVDGMVAYDALTDYSSYGGFGPDATSHHVSGVGVFTQPNSFLVDSERHMWISNNVGTEDPGGSEVTIAKTTAPGASNLTLSSASPTINLPDEGISLLADDTGNLWQTIEGTELWEYDMAGNFINLVSLFPSSPNVFAFCNATFDTSATMWMDDCGASGNGGQVFAVAPAAQQILGTYSGASTQPTASGTLAPGSGGNVYACNSGLSGYLVFNTSNLTTPVHTFNPPNKRCGQFLTVDGAGHIWSFASTSTGSALDELDSNGNQLTPNTGLTAISPEETAASGLAVFNQSSFDGQGGMAIDGSGNLWFLNGVAGSPGAGSSPANALVEFIGLASPTVTPTAVATQNGAQGTKP